MFQMIVGAVVGGGTGLALNKLARCGDGACPLTRSPLIAMALGVVLGLTMAASCARKQAPAQGQSKKPGEEKPAAAAPEKGAEAKAAEAKAAEPKAGGQATEAKSDAVVHVDAVEMFDKIVNGEKVPVLVDFHAAWCPPCKKLGPVIDKIGKDYAGKAKVCKVDIDKVRDLAQRFKVSAVPTVIIMVNGKEAERIVGGSEEATYTQLLDKHAKPGQ